MPNEWFRSWHGAPVDSKWLGVARRANVPVAVVVATVWALFDDASQNTDRGSIEHFSAEDFAAFLGIAESEVHRVVKTLAERGVVTADKRLAHWEKRQVFRERPEDVSTDRVRAHRARQETPGNAGVDRETPMKRHETPSNTSGTPPDTDTDTEGGDSLPPYPPSTHALPPVERVSRPREAKKPAKSNDKRKLPIDRDWRPSAEDLYAALAEGLTEIVVQREIRAFVDWHLAKGTRAADWSAAWRGWARRAVEMARGPPAAGQAQRKTRAEETQDALDQHRRAAQTRKAAGAAS